MQIKRPDTYLLVAAGTAYLVVAIGLWIVLGPASIVAALVLLLLAVTALQLHLFRVREKQDVEQLRQIQALIWLHHQIPFRAAGPWLTGWAATPELAATIYGIVRERRPEVVMELGSGASTVIIAAALEQNGTGRLYCLEQEAAYAAKTRRQLEGHGLSHRVQVTHAPIVRISIDGKDWKWYDTRVLPDVRPVDVLIVDGPNRELQSMARFPALPVLFDRLAPEAVVLVDDAGRHDEQRAIARWRELFGGLSVEYLDSPKGTAVIRRRP